MLGVAEGSRQETALKGVREPWRALRAEEMEQCCVQPHPICRWDRSDLL